MITKVNIKRVDRGWSMERERGRESEDIGIYIQSLAASSVSNEARGQFL